MKNITKKITKLSAVLTASILSASLPLTAMAAQNSPDANTYQPRDVQTVDYKKNLNLLILQKNGPVFATISWNTAN